MGPIGIAEIIMILIVLALLAIPVGIIIAIVWYFFLRNKTNPSEYMAARLSEIDQLRAKNLITDAEYEVKRRQILGGN